MRRLIRILLVAALALAAGAGLLLVRPELTAAERGRRLAEHNGCFACHGPEGTRGVANPGRPERTVPSYQGALMMYAKNAEEIREWIRDGGPQSRRRSPTWRAARDQGALRMPAYGSRLSPREIDDLVTFVQATSGLPEPEDGAAARGLERAHELGCEGCHGLGGRFARPNPGSLKGYVPPWDGEDFPELVRDRTEFGEWAERGVSRRFEANPVARYFLRRAALRMPAYRTHLAPGDVDTLWTYVQWLRRGTGTTGEKGTHK
jgi:mono/diheme cytochrome c family protein